MKETKNARITGTTLGIEDHGIMTFMLDLDYGGSRQGAGGYALDEWDETTHKRWGHAHSMDMIMAILRVVDVKKWEDLPGKHIRTIADSSKVYAIGNILKDDWLYFEKFWEDEVQALEDSK